MAKWLIPTWIFPAIILINSYIESRGVYPYITPDKSIYLSIAIMTSIFIIAFVCNVTYIIKSYSANEKAINIAKYNLITRLATIPAYIIVWATFIAYLLSETNMNLAVSVIVSIYLAAILNAMPGIATAIVGGKEMAYDNCFKYVSIAMTIEPILSMPWAVVMYAKIKSKYEEEMEYERY